MPTTVRLSAADPSDWMARRELLALPEELELILEESPMARAAFAAWPPPQQWDVAWFIQECADAATRRRRAWAARSVLEGHLALLEF
jgi:uncharacterized protein YdeI (YjbR/CyaY-like superfamily)